MCWTTWDGTSNNSTVARYRFEIAEIGQWQFWDPFAFLELVRPTTTQRFDGACLKPSSIMCTRPNDNITDQLRSYDTIDRRCRGYSIPSATNSVMLKMITLITENPIILPRLSPNSHRCGLGVIPDMGILLGNNAWSSNRAPHRFRRFAQQISSHILSQGGREVSARSKRSSSRCLAYDMLYGLAKAIGNDFHTNEQIGQLFNMARDAAGQIPCKDFPDNPDHQYQVNNQSPYWIRCCMPGC